MLGRLGWVGDVIYIMVSAPTKAGQRVVIQWYSGGKSGDYPASFLENLGKITLRDVREIRTMWKAGNITHGQIQEMFRISVAAESAITIHGADLSDKKCIQRIPKVRINMPVEEIVQVMRS